MKTTQNLSDYISELSFEELELLHSLFKMHRKMNGKSQLTEKIKNFKNTLLNNHYYSFNDIARNKIYYFIYNSSDITREYLIINAKGLISISYDNTSEEYIELSSIDFEKNITNLMIEHMDFCNVLEISFTKYTTKYNLINNIMNTEINEYNLKLNKT